MIRNQALEEEGLTAERNYLFDVTLWHDGQPVEPIGHVTLTFSGLPLNGMSGYQYDAKYDSDEGGVTCSPGNAGTNYWFGMSSSIKFYLPDASASGGSGKLNQSTKNSDMIFKFSGDDDVWVLVDGSLVLDIGGMHGVEEGTINFSTGEVWRSIGSGES